MFCQDESRLGLLPRLRRQITAVGVKPLQSVSFQYQYFWLYGAVAPATGESFFLELPYLNTHCFQVFIDEFSAAYPDSDNLIILDNAPCHISQKLQLPDNILLLFLPAYSPELNPIERLWLDLKTKITTSFDQIDQLRDEMDTVLSQYTPKALTSLTGYPYLINAIRGL